MLYRFALVKEVASLAGFEPATLGLTGQCSAIELQGNTLGGDGRNFTCSRCLNTVMSCA